MKWVFNLFLLSQLGKNCICWHLLIHFVKNFFLFSNRIRSFCNFLHFVGMIVMILCLMIFSWDPRLIFNSIAVASFPLQP